MDENLPSIQKLRSDIKDMRKISLFFSKEKRKQIVEMDKQLTHLTTQIELFNKNFSDLDWCAYDSMNISLMESANISFEKDGIDAGENVLIDYYKTDVEKITHWLKTKSEQFMERYELIQNALNDHFSGRYYASIPLFLIIIDGSVNYFTKSKGFLQKVQMLVFGIV